MNMLKRLLVLVLLCVAVPIQAQQRGTDRYSYQANPGCQIKIVVRAGATKYTINYRVTYNGAASVEGTVDPNSIGQVLLPASSQWYDLFVERAEADKTLYAVENGCDTAGGTQGLTAPAPILTNDQWNSAQQMLLTFVQQHQGGSSVSVPSTGGTGVCTISTNGTIRMREGHSTTAAVVGNLPRGTQFQVLDRFVEAIGSRTRTWYRIDKNVAAPTSAAAEVWVGGSVKTGGCGTSTVSVPASGAPSAGVANAILPQQGTWLLTYGSTVNVTCGTAASADYSTSGTLAQVIVEAAVAHAGSGFTFESTGYSQDSNGTWHGALSSPAAQANGGVLIRVDTPTRILGDIYITGSTLSNCTFKFPFWAAPR